jgi:hypothetical protein
MKRKKERCRFLPDRAGYCRFLPVQTIGNIYTFEKVKRELMSLNRIVLCIKDIQRLTGRGERHARYLLTAIRKAYGKAPRQPVSIQEYCRYTGFPEEEVRRQLGLHP